MSYSELDATTTMLLEQALDTAWFALPEKTRWSTALATDAITVMTRQLLEATRSGERNHHRLVEAALAGIDRT